MAHIGTYGEKDFQELTEDYLKATEEIVDVIENPQDVFLSDLTVDPKENTGGAFDTIPDAVPEGVDNNERIENKKAPHGTKRPDLSPEEHILLSTSVLHDGEIFAHLLDLDPRHVSWNKRMSAILSIPQFPLIVLTDTSRYWDKDTERQVYDYTTNMTPITSTDQLTKKELLRQAFFETQAKKQIEVIQESYKIIQSIIDESIRTGFFGAYSHPQQFRKLLSLVNIKTFKGFVAQVYGNNDDKIGTPPETFIKPFDRPPLGADKLIAQKHIKYTDTNYSRYIPTSNLEPKDNFICHNSILKVNFHTLPYVYSAQTITQHSRESFVFHQAGYTDLNNLQKYSTSLLSNYLSEYIFTLGYKVYNNMDESIVGNRETISYYNKNVQSFIEEQVDEIINHRLSDSTFKLPTNSPWIVTKKRTTINTFDPLQSYFQLNTYVDIDPNAAVLEAFRHTLLPIKTVFYIHLGSYSEGIKDSRLLDVIMYSNNTTGSIYPKGTIKFLPEDTPIYTAEVVLGKDLTYKLLKDFNMELGDLTTKDDQIPVNLISLPLRMLQPSIYQRSHCSPLLDANGNFRYYFPEKVFNPFYHEVNGKNVKVPLPKIKDNFRTTLAERVEKYVKDPKRRGHKKVVALNKLKDEIKESQEQYLMEYSSDGTFEKLDKLVKTKFKKLNEQLKRLDEQINEFYASVPIPKKLLKRTPSRTAIRNNTRTGIVCKKCNAFLSPDTVTECKHLKLDISVVHERPKRNYFTRMFQSFKSITTGGVNLRGAISYADAYRITKNRGANRVVYTIYTNMEGLPTASEIFDIYLYLPTQLGEYNIKEELKKYKPDLPTDAIDVVATKVTDLAFNLRIPIHATPQEPSLTTLPKHIIFFNYLKTNGLDYILKYYLSRKEHAKKRYKL